jgi:hypothetical protein
MRRTVDKRPRTGDEEENTIDGARQTSDEMSRTSDGKSFSCAPQTPQSPRILHPIADAVPPPHVLWAWGESGRHKPISARPPETVGRLSGTDNGDNCDKPPQEL